MTFTIRDISIILIYCSNLSRFWWRKTKIWQSLENTDSD